MVTPLFFIIKKASGRRGWSFLLFAFAFFGSGEVGVFFGVFAFGGEVFAGLIVIFYRVYGEVGEVEGEEGVEDEPDAHGEIGGALAAEEKENETDEAVGKKFAGEGAERAFEEVYGADEAEVEVEDDAGECEEAEEDGEVGKILEGDAGVGVEEVGGVKDFSDVHGSAGILLN